MRGYRLNARRLRWKISEDWSRTNCCMEPCRTRRSMYEVIPNGKGYCLIWFLTNLQAIVLHGKAWSQDRKDGIQQYFLDIDVVFARPE